jgi:hypothetical protein
LRISENTNGNNADPLDVLLIGQILERSGVEIWFRELLAFPGFLLFSQMKAARKKKKRANSRQLHTSREPMPRSYLGAWSV